MQNDKQMANTKLSKYEKNKDKIKEYYLDHKKEILERQKLYYIKNKTQILKKDKERYDKCHYMESGLNQS